MLKAEKKQIVAELRNDFLIFALNYALTWGCLFLPEHAGFLFTISLIGSLLNLENWLGNYYDRNLYRFERLQ